jgi:uncharacterized protein DUF4286
VTGMSYEVTATVEPALAGEFEQFMAEDHIPALLATGCFRSAGFVRLATGRYRMRYEADRRADLERYFETHAARVRGEFVARFPAGITLEREVGEVLGTWER